MRKIYEHAERLTSALVRVIDGVTRKVPYKLRILAKEQFDKRYIPDYITLLDKVLSGEEITGKTEKSEITLKFDPKKSKEVEAGELKSVVGSANVNLTYSDGKGENIEECVSTIYPHRSNEYDKSTFAFSLEIQNRSGKNKIRTYTVYASDIEDEIKQMFQKKSESTDNMTLPEHTKRLHSDNVV